MYSNLHILGVLFSMPVSVAYAERSFSTSKRLKTYLGSTMDSERLNGFVLLLIHSRLAKDIDVDQILRGPHQWSPSICVSISGYCWSEVKDDENVAWESDSLH